ncbi:hypothetical protein BJY01DRAFT_43277 [Aspergillus pseudoustus]|uniref:Uncharacterized protein n=1 Tax=Aspergillus pseudoustus TaxID=1810923 RepID=A0ABR4KPN1_9EURO
MYSLREVLAQLVISITTQARLLPDPERKLQDISNGDVTPVSWPVLRLVTSLDFPASDINSMRVLICRIQPYTRIWLINSVFSRYYFRSLSVTRIFGPGLSDNKIPAAMCLSL